jgi:hypothetical protein
MAAKKLPKRTRAALERQLDLLPEAKARARAALQPFLTTPPGPYTSLRQAPRESRWAKSKFRA